MIKIGITGNIASGKSEFENILKNKGFLVYDLDNVCHFLYENDDDIKKKLLNEFNSLDRKTIANIVFKDDIKRKTLENIIHPKLKEIILDLFKKNQDKKAIFISGALLFESGFNELFDKIIFIDSPITLRLKRLQKRNNLNKTDALNRINSQKDDYKSKADYVILNNKTLTELEKEAEKLLKDLITRQS